jgi:hypothetical protein
MVTLADLQTAVNATVSAVVDKEGTDRAREMDLVTTAAEFDAAVTANDTNMAIDAARRIADKAATVSLKPAAAEIIDTLEQLDPES